MIVSHKYSFIFVHVWKTGGNSIRDCLKNYAEALNPKSKHPRFDLMGFSSKIGKSKPMDIDQHITFNEIKAIIGNKRFNRYFKFAFVRNPLDLVVSHYHFITQYKNNHPRKALIRNFKSFEDYIKWSETHEMIQLSQKKFVFDEQDTLLADYIGRYEFFQESFDEIMNRLKIKGVRLIQLNKSDHDHFMKYYNSRTEGIARSVLSEDFRIFSY